MEDITIKTDLLLSRHQIEKIHKLGYRLSVTLDDFDVYPLEFIHGAVIEEVNHLYLLTDTGLERLGGAVPVETLQARMHLFGLMLRDDSLITLGDKVIAELNMLSRYVDLHPKLKAIPEGILRILPDNFHILSEKRYARVGDINKATLLGKDATLKNKTLWGETV